MKIKSGIGDIMFDGLNVLIMLFLMIITLYPFLYVLFASLSNSDMLIRTEGLLLHPVGFTMNAYKLVLKNPNIFTGYGNTVFVLVFGTGLNLILTIFGAYALSRKSLPFKRIFTFIIIFTMYFSGGLIPKYLLVYSTLGLGNSLSALILPNAIATYNLIVMRTSFAAIPVSLEESAKLDGSNDFTILFRIIIPLSSAVIAVIALFYSVEHWNSWFNAMIYLRDRKLYPLQLILREILIVNSTENMAAGNADVNMQIGESLKHATIIVATLPILFFYPYLQKYFVKGVMVGSLKG